MGKSAYWAMSALAFTEGIVRAAVIDNDHLQVRVGLGRHTGHGIGQVSGLAETGDDHRDQRQGIAVVGLYLRPAPFSTAVLGSGTAVRPPFRGTKETSISWWAPSLTRP